MSHEGGRVTERQCGRKYARARAARRSPHDPATPPPRHPPLAILPSCRLTDLPTYRHTDSVWYHRDAVASFQEKPMRIAVDAAGGDHGPAVVVVGAVAGAKRFAVDLLLAGAE